MKAGVFVLLLVVCYVKCKKTYAPIDKHANVDFINMEGGGIKPAPRPGASLVTPPPKPQPAPVKPTQYPQTAPTPKPVLTPQSPTIIKPAPAAITKPAQPPVTPTQPKTPNQIKPVQVYPSPVANPITTPGPGSVKDLVNFYNTQGKGSPIRPYPTNIFQVARTCRW